METACEGCGGASHPLVWTLWAKAEHVGPSLFGCTKSSRGRLWAHGISYVLLSSCRHCVQYLAHLPYSLDRLRGAHDLHAPWEAQGARLPSLHVFLFLSLLWLPEVWSSPGSDASQVFLADLRHRCGGRWRTFPFPVTPCRPWLWPEGEDGVIPSGKFWWSGTYLSCQCGRRGISFGGYNGREGGAGSIWDSSVLLVCRC